MRRDTRIEDPDCLEREKVKLHWAAVGRKRNESPAKERLGEDRERLVRGIITPMLCTRYRVEYRVHIITVEEKEAQSYSPVLVVL